MLMLNVMLLFN